MQIDDLVAGIACGVRRDDREAVVDLALKVRVTRQRHRTGGGVDAERRGVGARQAVGGRACVDIAAIRRRRRINQGAGGHVLVHACGGAGSDARGDLVKVVDHQCDDLVAGIACSISGDDREAVDALGLVVRRGVDRHRTSGGIDAERRGVGARQAVGGGACVDIAAIRRRRRINQAAGGHVLVHA